LESAAAISPVAQVADHARAKVNYMIQDACRIHRQTADEVSYTHGALLWPEPGQLKFKVIQNGKDLVRLAAGLLPTGF
jgi:hypothetical protein